MPLYDLECEKCGYKVETITSYSKIEELVCIQCHETGAMKIAPASCKPSFRINGFSAANGYHRETIDYAKGPIG